MQKILTQLHDCGHEAFVVGGCVRDSLLGFSPKDWDVTTSATPEEVKLALAPHRLIETGLRHGTVTALYETMSVEITTYRIDGIYSDNRRPDSVCFTGSLTEDLARRDFTVNAMAYSDRDGLIDCFGGQEDLRAGILRCVGNPDRRLEEDALRILRGLRFCAVLGLRPEEKTAESIRTHRQLLDHIAKERIGAELIKLLCGKNAAGTLREFPLVVGQILPEIVPMIGFDQHNPHHIYDVWEHTLHALDAVAADPILRLSVLLHDSGKPHTFTRDAKGVGHFRGHEAVSVQLAEQALRRLRMDSKTIRRVCLLIRLHDIPVQADAAWVRRRLARLGEDDFRALLAIKRADTLAQNPVYQDRISALKTVTPILEQVLAEHQCFSLHDLKVNGNDMLALGAPAGPPVGDLLHCLLGAVISGSIPNEREALLRQAAVLLHEKHC